jgi:hypothetical protein
VEYVMVPVPDQLEARVREFLAQRAATGHAGWSDEVITRLYEQLDGPSRTAIEAIARGVVDDQPVTLSTLAKVAGTTTREMLGIALELVQHLQALGGPTFPIVILDSPEGADDERPVVMPRDGAHMVVATAWRQ